jgi:SAM-dependent methyltransferase
MLGSTAGRELLDRLADQDVEPDRALALSRSLRADYPPELLATALTAQALRIAARAKFSRADQMLFTRSGLEQASSELTAGHAAARFAGVSVVADLCCGIGGNLAALAGDDGQGQPGVGARSGPADLARRVVAVDADLAVLEFARHNTSACAPGAEVGFVQADVRGLPLTGIDAVFIDPARRDGQRRLPPGHYQPALEECLRLVGLAPLVGIKAAPGLDRDRVPAGWETEFVAVGRELKEALLWSPALASAARRATVLPSGDTLASSGITGPTAPVPPVPLAPPGAYLLDPSPAVTRAGLVGDLALMLDAWQIDPMIAFLSSDEPVRTPFARTLAVLESAPWHEKRFARRLRELGIGAADIRRRGLAGDVQQIHRRLDLRGERSATIVITRADNRPWGLICTPLSDGQTGLGPR